MILLPMILYGVLFGWWWKYSLPISFFVWPIVIIFGGNLSGMDSSEVIRVLLLGGLLGLANAVVGAIIPIAVKTWIKKRAAV